jgi:hypothetical protein
MISNLNYDIMLGSNGTYTPFRYEINYRNYFLCTEGSVKIKMTPPQNIKYLYPEYDYENFEFRSPINPWNVQSKYAADFEKMKCLEVSLTKGKIIFIPSYWWYSIQFSNSSSISCFRYRTYVNNLAISPYIFMHILQLQNIKRDVAKKVPLDVLNQKDDTNYKHYESYKNTENTNSLNTNLDIIQTTNINDLPSNERNGVNQPLNEPLHEIVSEPAPIMEYENFGAEIK